MNYYKRHIGDYMKDASHLSLLEHGVYMRLLDVYYTRECAIPVDQAARLISARTKEEKAALEVVTCEFFTVVDGAYTQTRCDSEIAAMQHKTETNREVGRLGGRPRKETQTVSDENPEITQTVSEKNPTITLATSHKPITNTPIPPTGGFEVFWECWPKNERKQDKAKCSEKWKRDSLDAVAEAIVADVTAKKHSQKWRGGFIEAPMVYLNNRRWEDGAAGAATGPKRGTDEYAALHKSAGWWREAGFPTIWDAMASKCWHDNAHDFRDGKRVEVAE